MKNKKRTKRMQISMAIIMLFAMLALSACGSKEEKADIASEGTDTETKTGGAVFGTFTAQTLEGEEVTEAIFAEADLTMVNIWGTFCGPCINEMPDLGELGREYADSGVQIVGLISDVTEAEDETALEIVETTKADYTHIIASPDLQTGILQQVQVVPTTVFVDREGKQVGVAYSGANSKSGWQEIIEELRTKVQ